MMKALCHHIKIILKLPISTICWKSLTIHPNGLLIKFMYRHLIKKRCVRLLSNKANVPLVKWNRWSSLVTSWTSSRLSTSAILQLRKQKRFWLSGTKVQTMDVAVTQVSCRGPSRCRLRLVVAWRALLQRAMRLSKTHLHIKSIQRLSRSRATPWMLPTLQMCKIPSKATRRSNRSTAGYSSSPRKPQF